MTIFQSLYCYSYQHSLDNNTNTSLDNLRKTGTIMASVVLLMWLLSLTFLTLPFGLGESIIDVLQSIFGYRSGKTIGQFGGLGLFLLIYPLVHFTVGSQKSFQKTMNQYNNLPQQEQTNVVSKGVMVLGGSIAVFVISILIGGIAGTYL